MVDLELLLARGSLNSGDGHAGLNRAIAGGADMKKALSPPPALLLGSPPLAYSVQSVHFLRGAVQIARPHSSAVVE